MPLHQCVQACVILSAACQSSAACHGSKLSSGDIIKKPGDNDKQFEVQICLGSGTSGEMWTLNGSDYVLKFQTSPPVGSSSECLFAQIAAQKDSAHFANCFDHGSGEAWTLEGSDLVLKYAIIHYTVWQRVDGETVSALMQKVAGIHVSEEGFNRLFPDLDSLLGHLNELFHIFDALQKPGTIAPGIGVRQWHTDAYSHNIVASADGLKLIDYGLHKWCCNAPQECAGGPGFEDVKIQPCGSLPKGSPS